MGGTLRLVPDDIKTVVTGVKVVGASRPGSFVRFDADVGLTCERACSGGDVGEPCERTVRESVAYPDGSISAVQTIQE